MMTLYQTSKQLKTEIRASIALSIPLATSQLAQAATGFVDTVMMGWMGSESLAAGGLAAAMFMTFWVSGLGWTNGVTVLAAEAYGRGDFDRLCRIFNHGLFLCVLVTLPVMVILFQSQAIMLSLGQSSTTVNLAYHYVNAIAWGYFPAIVFVMLRGMVSSMNAPRMPMAIAIVGLLFNAIANYILGFGKFGFPVMGLTGLAVATAMTHWLMSLSLLLYLLFNFKFLKLEWIKLDLPLLKQLFKLGILVGIAFTLEVALFSVTTFLMGRLGVDVLAAHQIVFQTIVMIFMIPLGISYATTIRVGQSLGQRNRDAINRSAFMGMFLGTGFMVVTATLLILFPNLVLSLYLDLSIPANQALIPIVTPMLTVAALAQILDGLQTTAAGALRGLQDTKIPMILSFIAFWGVGLVSGCLLGFGVGWGGVGLWTGQAIGIATASVLFVLRFRHLSELAENPILAQRRNSEANFTV
jgi:multidrug resistance protein, MATE family